MEKSDTFFDRISALLTHTSEQLHLLIIDPIIIETDEDIGLSTLQKPAIKEIWQDTLEGIITFKYEGDDTEYDLSDFPEYHEQLMVELCLRSI